MALVASAMVARSVMMLRLARADLERTRAEDVLDGAQLQAAATVIRAGSGGPYRWAEPTDMGFAEALAESETEKLSPAAGANLPDAVLAAYGVDDVAALKARLTSAAGTASLDVSALDAAPLWHECAASLVSRLGLKPADQRPGPHIAPSSVSTTASGLPNPPAWRVGETWRVRITTAAGWRDDRIVRFTGDAHHPVAVVRRELSRTSGGQGRCEAIWAAGA
jgi:hypothetical protein